MATANSGRITCQLVFQELVRPPLEDVAFVIDGQGAALGVQGGFHILPLETATHFETESQHMQITMGRDGANESDAPHGNRASFERDLELLRQ